MIRSLLLLLAASTHLFAEPEPAASGKGGTTGPDESSGPVTPVEPSTLPAPDQPVEPVKPPIKELDADRVQIGDVILNKKTREIRFPAAVNMAGGELLEFILVHTNGKVHESLLVTDVSATNINLAFKLLRYPASIELYGIVEQDGTMSNEFPKVADDVMAGSRIKLSVEWQEEGKPKTASINEWIAHGTTGEQMPAADPWVYGGSRVREGKFVPDVTGDYIAIFLSYAALINFSGKDNDSDEVWLPFPKRVPPEGTKVTVVITPYQKPAAEK